MTALVTGLQMPAPAEVVRRGGPISVTFHEENKRRTEPTNLYVVKKNGLTTWRNFKDKKTTTQNESQFVYEIKPLQNRPRYTPADFHDVARAEK